MAAEVGHDGSCGLVCCLTHVLVPISEAEEEVREKVNNIRLKQTPKNVTERFKGKQGSFPVPVVLLVSNGILKGLHHFELFQSGDTKALHKTSQAVGCPPALAVTGRVE